MADKGKSDDWMSKTGGGKRDSAYSKRPGDAPPDGYGVTNEKAHNIFELVRAYNRKVKDRSYGE